MPGVSDASLYEDDSFKKEAANRHVLAVAQIESVRGVENLDEIAAIDGVGALMFGTGDYSIDAGLPISLGGPPHPTLPAALAKWAEAGRKYGNPLLR